MIVNWNAVFRRWYSVIAIEPKSFLFYVVLYNRMMAYVEHHAYPNSDSEERDEK